MLEIAFIGITVPAINMVKYKYNFLIHLVELVKFMWETNVSRRRSDKRNIWLQLYFDIDQSLLQQLCYAYTRIRDKL
jgi:hypothetical protein